MSNDSLNRKIGAILQLIQLVCSIIISLVYTKYMLRVLGQSEYGVYSVCSSTIGYLSLLSLGMNSSYIRFYTRSRTKKDSVSEEELNWQYIRLFSFFGVLSLILGGILSVRADILFNVGYSEEMLKKAKLLMIIFAFNMAISFPASVFSSYISSQQRFIFLKLINVIKTVFSPMAQFIMLMFGYGSIGIAFALTFVNLIADIINVLFCFTKLNMRFLRCKLNYSFIKKIASFSFYIGIGQIVYQLNFSADKLVLSKISSVEQVAIYSVGATLNSHVEQIGSAIANLFDPKINRIISSDESEEEKNKLINRIFIRVGRVQFYLLMLIVTGFVFFGRFFIRWWTGSEYDDSYYITLLLIIPLTIPLVQNMAVYIQRAKYKHKFRSILYLITSLINVGISILLVKLHGAIGAALGTTITLLVNSIVNNIYYDKVIGLDIKKFWSNIIRITAGLVVPVIFGLVFMFCFELNSFFVFSLVAVLYSLIYFISIYCFSFNIEEKKLVLSFGQKIFNKVHKHL